MKFKVEPEIFDFLKFCVKITPNRIGDEGE
jgi:hypothetical protein